MAQITLTRLITKEWAWLYLNQIKAISLWAKIINELKAQEPIPREELGRAKIYLKNSQRGLARLREPVKTKKRYCIYTRPFTEFSLLNMIKDKKLWQELIQEPRGARTKGC